MFRNFKDNILSVFYSQVYNVEKMENKISLSKIDKDTTKKERLKKLKKDLEFLGLEYVKDKKKEI